jgi:hypothetical protein
MAPGEALMVVSGGFDKIMPAVQDDVVDGMRVRQMGSVAKTWEKNNIQS